MAACFCNRLVFCFYGYKTINGGVGVACRSSLGCFGCKNLEHYYYSTGNMDCKLKGHITLGFGDDMGCEKYESNV